ncbi:MAG: hypothetical protein ACRDRN_06925 [Sciscionella sp.]
MRMERDWLIDGTYRLWRMRVSCFGTEDAVLVRPGKLWPARKFERLDAHFRDLISLHELALDAESR